MHRSTVLLALLVPLAACERGGTRRSTEPAVARAELPSVPRARDTVPAGTTLGLTLYQTLSVAGRVGDAFVATVAEPVRGDQGAVVIPEGAVVRGRVTQVARPGTVGESGLLRLAFESVVVRGRVLPLSATVVNAEPQRRGAAAPAPDTAADSLRPATARVLDGGGEGDPAQGTSIAMGTAAVEMVLPAGSALTIRLDAPLVSRAAPARAQ